MKVKCLFAALFLFIAAGCITAGRNFPAPPVKQIINGETTKVEVLTTFGEPYQKGLEDGRETWTYYRVKYNPGSTLSKELHIVFDDQGRVESYSFTSNFPDEP